MAKGPLGVTVDGPDGPVPGFLDQVDQENWRIGDFGGRTHTRIDQHRELRIASDDVGSIAKQGTLSTTANSPKNAPTLPWRVEDGPRLEGDGVVATLYLVAT